MDGLFRWTASPIWARVVPFAALLILTGLQGRFGEASLYWVYALKTVVAAGLLWAARRTIPEIQWRFSWEAFAAGGLVLLLWIGLDGFYPKPGSDGPAWNPLAAFHNGAAGWFFVAVRLAGSTLLIPVLEEVFYRSLVYRYLLKQDFETLPLGTFARMPLLVTSAIFAAEHREWLPGFLCGLIFQGLVLRKNRLGDAIVAHAVTNCLLGLWVVWSGQWRFW